MSLIPNGKRFIDSQYDRFQPPLGTDAVTVEYPDNVTEIYRFRMGGTAGTILKSVQVIYSNSCKNEMLSAEVLP